MTRLPLYTVQQRAFDTTLSPESRVAYIRELGARYAELQAGPAGSYGAIFQKRLAGAYVRGFLGGPAPVRGYRRPGGNWSAPVAAAWRQGEQDAAALKDLITSNAAEPHLPKATKA